MLCALMLLSAVPVVGHAQEDESPPVAPAAADEQVSEAPPSWLPWTVIGAGALGLTLSAIFLVDLVLVVSPALDDARTFRADPDIACPGSTPSQACFDERLEVLNQAAGLDFLVAAPLGVGGFIAVATGLVMLLEGEE